MSRARSHRRVCRRARGAGALVALSLAAAGWSSCAAGDDADLTHRLGADQGRSSFEEKLERIRESARERAAQEFDPSAFEVERPEAPPGYHGSQRLRLTPRTPAGDEAAEAAPPGTRASDAEELRERRRRQLHQSQRARALHHDLPPGADRPGREAFELRHERRRLRTEQRTEAFHRKLMQ